MSTVKPRATTRESSVDTATFPHDAGSRSTDSHDAAGHRESSRIVGRLKLYFAALSCLGGLVLSAGNDTESIPVIAVFFAVFGYVFVDCLRLFALPPIAAYAAMAVAALYCVSDFADLDAPGNHQMVAVAQLLVFVQAILMLQRKSRRIFEQLGVFCLLELVVAAVFNNAISYGLLMIPISIIGAWALSLLSALSASEGFGELDGLASEDDAVGFLRRTTPSSTIRVSAPESFQSLASAALRLPRIALLTLAPAVVLVGAIFFYALPRTTDAARVRNRGNALVGFTDELRLEQIGQMLQSTQVAMRLYTTNRATGQDYDIVGGIYLRGRVLERYQARMSGEGNSATWNSVPLGLISGSQSLPMEYFPTRSTDENFYDSVNVAVVCESMRSRSLFAIAPYHQVKFDPEIVHQVDRWTIARRSQDDWVFPRKTYSFGTHAFRSGVQSDLLARWSQGESAMSPGRSGDAQERAEDYVDQLLHFDIDAMPSAAAMAEQFALAPTGERQSDYEVAKAIESYFMSSGDFDYTLKLNAESIPGLDPIEQFLMVDKKGHCQYFASAMVMMLRSQGIPARIVVGYHTDEYNELGRHYVARQLHAHSWVEALIDRDELNVNRNIYGQPDSEQYWLRLDPTPAGGRIRESTGGVVQMLDMAQNMWDDYVVDMDAGRQDNTLLGGGITPMSGSYEKLVDWLSLTIRQIRAGQLGGGSLASRELFSWPAAVLGVMMTLAAAVLLRVRTPAWIKRRITGKSASKVALPTLPFYAETLSQLARVGINRQSWQTPAELAMVAKEKLQHPMIPSISKPLEVLTSAFYRLRFGVSHNGQQELENSDSVEHARKPSAERNAASVKQANAVGVNVDQATIDRALDELKQSVDLMMVNTSRAERKA